MARSLDLRARGGGLRERGWLQRGTSSIPPSSNVDGGGAMDGDDYRPILGSLVSVCACDSRRPTPPLATAGVHRAATELRNDLFTFQPGLNNAGDLVWGGVDIPQTFFYSYL